MFSNQQRVTPKCPSILAQELYVFNRCGLLQSFEVRPACTTDEQGVQDLIQHVDNKEGLMTDLRQFNKARRDPVRIDLLHMMSYQ